MCPAKRKVFFFYLLAILSPSGRVAVSSLHENVPAIGEEDMKTVSKLFLNWSEILMGQRLNEMSFIFILKFFTRETERSSVKMIYINNDVS